MSAWGDTDLDSGLSGNQPRFVKVWSNFGREIGFWEKQLRNLCFKTTYFLKNKNQIKQ